MRDKLQNGFREVVDELLEQPELQPDEIFRSRVGDVRVVGLMRAAHGGHKLTLSDLPGTKEVGELESLLRFSFDGGLSHNMVGSLTPEDERSISKFYFSGISSGGVLEEDLGAMEEILSDVPSEATPQDAAEFVDPRLDWVQI